MQAAAQVLRSCGWWGGTKARVRALLLAAYLLDASPDYGII